MQEIKEGLEKILIFDKHRAYARLLKLEFGNSYEIHCPQNSELNDMNYAQFSFAIVIVQDYEELVNIFPIMHIIPNIILGSKLKDIENLSRYSDHVMLIDLNLTKNELLSEIRNIFELFSKVENNASN